MSPSVSLHVARELWNVRFVHLLAIEGVFQFATYMLNPVITGYVVLLGASLATGGFVAGLVATSSLVVRPFTGMVADRLSKTTLLVVAAALFTAAAFGCALAESVAWISAFRIVQGVAFAFRSAVVVSLVSVTVSRDHVGRAVGWVGMVTMVSSAIAPSVASRQQSARREGRRRPQARDRRTLAGRRRPSAERRDGCMALGQVGRVRGRIGVWACAISCTSLPFPIR